MAAVSRILSAAMVVAALTVSCGPQPPPLATGRPESAGPTSTGTGTPPTTRGTGRPGGQPPGVRHDLPRVHDNLTAQDDWVNAVRNRCNEVGEVDRCLTFRYVVHEIDGQGRSRSIPNPGPGYADADEPRYDACTVTDVEPRGGDDVRIPSGSRITVSIDCYLREDGGSGDNGSDNGSDNGNGNGATPTTTAEAGG